MIAEFYLVDRGLRHRLPGFSSMGLSSRRVSAGAPTPMVTLRGRPYGSDSRMSEVGSIGINPHRARSLLRDRNLEEPLEISPRAIGFDPRDQMPTTTSSKSIRGSFTIAKSRSFCRPRPNPIWVPKHQLTSTLEGFWAIQGVTPVRDHWMPFIYL